MAKPSVVTKQNDFSSGEVDPELKRSDDSPAFKTSGRQMRNWRILDARGLKNRPGRRVLFLDGPRVDEVLMSPGNVFYLVFAQASLRVYNAAGAKVFDSGGVMPWPAVETPLVVWDIYRLSIYITFHGMNPRVLTWDGVSQTSTWTMTTYSTASNVGSSQRSIFYRLSPLGITMLPSATNGNIAVTFSSPIMTAGRVGTFLRYINSQILITSFVNPSFVLGAVVQSIPGATQLIFNAFISAADFFNIGDELIGSTSTARGVVVSFPASNQVIVQRLTATEFVANELAVGPRGIAGILNLVTGLSPQAVTLWDEDVFNSLQGFPLSCFVDQGRLGFCDFPSLPGLIAWSAFGVFNDLYTDENNVGPTNAIQELVPGKSRVLFVVPGTEASEFVFCDNAVYYIPITQAAPLQPGSVAFNTITSDGVAVVKPRRAGQSIVYVGAGGDIFAVQAVGAYSRAYIIAELSELHSHLIEAPVAVAIPDASDQFEERYIYILMSDASIMVGKYSYKGGIIEDEKMSWLPWSGVGTPKWVSARGPNVLFTGAYTLQGVPNLVERLDDTLYLDAAMLYNVIPTALTPPLTKGPLWWMPNGTVDLMDGPLGTRMMGTYGVDANGFIIPQFNAGEDLTSVNLLVGQTWTATVEPFIPSAQAGQNVHQRMWKRRLRRVQVYVQASTGFVMARLFGGPVTSISPAVGTIMKARRITTWNQDDDPTQPPPLREQSYLDRPIGLSHDPRWCIIKDTPGPLIILEISTEVSV